MLKGALAVVEQEEARLAADLHDGPIQVLTALGLRLDLLASHLLRDQHQQEAGEVTQMREQVAGEITGLRRTLTALHPPELEPGCLLAALQHSASELLGEAGITWELHGRIETPLAPELETIIYRVAREALLNTAHHSQATHALIELERSNKETLRIRVADNGIGLDPTQPTPSPDGAHYGLTGMQQRIESCGGSLHIDSHPGAGTLLEATLPLLAHPANTGHMTSPTRQRTAATHPRRLGRPHALSSAEPKRILPLGLAHFFAGLW